MRVVIAFILLTGLSLSSVYAESWPPALQPGAPYAEARNWLQQHGWQPVVNARIADSSLFANEIAAQGMPEVVDCISMALDGCTFRWQNKSRRLEISTITRQLQIDKLALRKK